MVELRVNEKWGSAGRFEEGCGEGPVILHLSEANGKSDEKPDLVRGDDEGVRKRRFC